MSEYHLYLLDRNGRVKARIDLSCEDDAAARALSRDRVPESESFELWQGARRLHPDRTFPMDDPHPGPSR
jgi:hypothetical protein